MKAWVLKDKVNSLNFVDYKEESVSLLKPDEIFIKQKGCIISNEDILYKKNILTIPKLIKEKGDLIFGICGGGVVSKIGTNVTGLETNDTVIYPFSPFGAYCEERLIDHRYCIKVPKELNFDKCLTFIRNGLQATMLIYNVLTLQEEDTILIHDISSPVGIFMCKIAKKHNIKVIGTISTEEDYFKVFNIADLVINISKKDLFSEVNNFTNGIGVRVVYDFFGKEVFDSSVKIIRPFGIYVSCGYLTGILEPIDILTVRKKNLFFTAPTLELYNLTRYGLILNAQEVFKFISEGLIEDNIVKYSFNSVGKIFEQFEEKGIKENILFTI